jgi:hypothetical protein
MNSEESPYDQESCEPSFDEDTRDRSQGTRELLNNRRREVPSESASPRNSRRVSRQVNWHEERYDVESSVGTDSRSHSSSSETGSSYTTSSSEEDFALNANCMNTLFNKNGPASNIIRCTKDGPNGEVQLKMTLPLPHQLMKGLEDFVPTKKEIQTAMEHIRVNGDKLAKKCNFDYSNQHFHEQVLDDDITGRIRPEFYNSLFQSQTDVTSTVGDELAVQSVMLGTDRREPESSSRFHHSEIPRIESKHGTLGLSRPHSLPSQIELSGNSSYMSSQDSCGLMSFKMKTHHPSNFMDAKKGGFIQPNIRDSIEKKFLEHPTLNSSRFDISARKPQIPNYDEPSREPSFDEGHNTSGKFRTKNQGMHSSTQPENITFSKFSIPDEKPGKDWISAKREQLEFIDDPRDDCQENVVVTSKTKPTFSRKGMLNAEGIPDSVRCDKESTDHDLKTACSDLTIDEEAFASDENVVVTPVSLSDQSTHYPKPKLVARTSTKSSDFSMKDASPKKTFRVTRDDPLAPTTSSDELMGPAKKTAQELMRPLVVRTEANPVTSYELTHLPPAWSTEDVPMDELMDPAGLHAQNDVEFAEQGTHFGKSWTTKFERDTKLTPPGLSNEEAPLDELISPAKFFNHVSYVDTNSGDNKLITNDMETNSCDARLIATHISTEHSGNDGFRGTDVNGTMTTSTTAASDVPPPMTPPDISIDNSTSIEAPMDEPGHMFPSSNIHAVPSVPYGRVHSLQSESRDSGCLIDESLGKPIAKSVSSSSNDKSQVTVPTENKNLLVEETFQYSAEKSQCPIVEPHPIDFAARLKVAAAARLESMNDLRVSQKPSSALISFDPLSPSTSRDFPASKTESCFDANANKGDDRRPATADTSVYVTSRHCDDDEETAREFEGILQSEIDARSQAVEINYIGGRLHDSQSFTTEPPLAIAHTSTTGDGSQTVATMETPLLRPPGGTFDTYDRSAWSSISGSHFKKTVPPRNNFYDFDEEGEECDDDEEEEYLFDERVAKLSSLLPASTRNNKRIVMVATFNLPSFFLNVFTALWILIGAWTKQLFVFKVSKKTKTLVVTKAEPNFREFQPAGDIQTTTCTKIQGSRFRGISGGYHNEDGTVVHYVVPDVHGSGEVEPNRQIWSISSSSQSTQSRKWNTPKMATTYSSIRQSFSRSDARSTNSTKEWSAASSLGYSGFVEE